MAKATWNGVVIAESDDTIVVEGNLYFPPGSVNPNVLRDSAHTSQCPWKGTAHYKDIVVNGDLNGNAAWYYPEPSAAAQEITGYYAFWNGVDVRP
jgi:uncharacterized protein (DUF427 family)